MSQRVLVTGATAPLGRAVVERLITRPDVTRVIAIGRACEVADPARLVLDPRVLYKAVDLTHPRALHDLLWGLARDERIAAVIHGIHHRRARDSGPRLHAQNVDVTRELILGCLSHPTIRRLVVRSFAEVYSFPRATSDLIDEDVPLDLDPLAPQWVRDRVESDLTACSYFGRDLSIAVLRCAEVLASGTGSQLWDYLQSRVCFRPLGFDPMLNLLSLEDAADALILASGSMASGVFNIPGYDTLPLSLAIEYSRRVSLPVPGPLMSPLYRLRAWATQFEFRYDINLRRFHFGGVLDGSRAARGFGYLPQMAVRWPRAWWQQLLAELAARDHAASSRSADSTTSSSAATSAN